MYRKGTLAGGISLIRILGILFIKDYVNVTAPSVRRAYGILCGAVGILLNVILFGLKFGAGTLTNSISITADAFNNLSDAGSSIITLIGFKMSGQKPDVDHPFGHGRIEYLSGLLVSIAILIMAFELIKTSFTKILHPEAVAFQPLIIVILSFSILTKLYMYFYNKNIGKTVNSPTLHATALDSLSDTIATFVVLLTSVISYKTGFQLDGYAGVVVGIFIGYTGFSAAKETISPLLGQTPDPEFVREIARIVTSHEAILGLHDLVVHDYGPGRIMISLHAEIPADGDILLMHDTIDNIEKELQKKLHCVAVIHMDPIRNNDPTTMELKERVTEVLKSIHSDLSLHDFRVVSGSTHTNLIFDVVVPYQFELQDQELEVKIQSMVSAINPEYFIVIEIDRAFC